MRDDAVLRRALPLGRGLGRVKYADVCPKIQKDICLVCCQCGCETQTDPPNSHGKHNIFLDGWVFENMPKFTEHSRI